MTASVTAAPQPTDVIACKVCGQAQVVRALEPATVAECVRCGSRIVRRSHGSLHRTAALSLAALILYVPANLLPILHLELYGATSENTVWDGVVKFYQGRNYVIALIVLLASIVIPLFKLLGLFLVVITTRFRSRRMKKPRTWLFRFID